MHTLLPNNEARHSVRGVLHESQSLSLARAAPKRSAPLGSCLAIGHPLSSSPSEDPTGRRPKVIALRLTVTVSSIAKGGTPRRAALVGRLQSRTSRNAGCQFTLTSAARARGSTGNHEPLARARSRLLSSAYVPSTPPAAPPAALSNDAAPSSCFIASSLLVPTSGYHHLSATNC